MDDTDLCPIARYWGKARPSPGDTLLPEVSAAPWHPLVYHMLDVAAAMDHLLTVRPWLLKHFAPGDDSVRAALIYAAALHDLGKFTPGFQWKANDVVGSDASYRGTLIACNDVGHDQSGISISRDVLHIKSHRLQTWVEAACTHHGRGQCANPPGMRSLGMTSLVQTDILAFHEALLSLLGPQDFLRDEQSEMDIAKEARAVAGLVTIADWIGSNREWFPYTAPDMSIGAYWACAKGKAEKAFKDAGLIGIDAPKPMSVADMVTGPDTRPTPLQTWAADVPLAPNMLAILEDLTGSGKTEAAMVLATRLIAAGHADGLYWAMPTEATANAMYARMGPLAKAIFGQDASASLMGSKAKLNAKFKAAIERFPTDGQGGTNTAAAETICAPWLANDGRLGFLARLGAGTIDQAQLGILAGARHGPVRIAGLMGKVLIIDEAHAYDAYTGRLMESLLEVHCQLGGCAIVLTATMPSDLRAQLLCRWGAKPDTPPSIPCAAAASAGGQALSRALTAQRGTVRDTPVVQLVTEAAALDVLAKADAADAAAIWIRNTVHDVLNAADMARAAGLDVTVFHSRFISEDRRRIEDGLLARFGKSSEDRKGIVIASQVAEQSLDVDFDVMMSDLAPLDSLIQRAGRLHRHTRPRPAGYENPILHVLGPQAKENATGEWYGHMFEKAQYVYQAHGVLWRTARMLAKTGGLMLKNQPVRALLDAVYDIDDPATPEALKEKDIAAAGESMADQGGAAQASIKLADGYTYSPTMDERRAKTRLGESQQVQLAIIENDRLRPLAPVEDSWREAWAMSEITLRLSQVEKIGKISPPPDMPPRAAQDIKRHAEKYPWSSLWVGTREADETITFKTDRGETLTYDQELGLILAV